MTLPQTNHTLRELKLAGHTFTTALEGAFAAMLDSGGASALTKLSPPMRNPAERRSVEAALSRHLDAARRKRAAAAVAPAPSAREVRAAMRIQAHVRGRPSRLVALVVRELLALPPPDVQAACAAGLDAMGSLLSEKLGPHVWHRAVHNAPDGNGRRTDARRTHTAIAAEGFHTPVRCAPGLSAGWEEAQMSAAISEALRHPKRATQLWLLCTPTRWLLEAHVGLLSTPSVRGRSATIGPVTLRGNGPVRTAPWQV